MARKRTDRSKKNFVSLIDGETAETSEAKMPRSWWSGLSKNQRWLAIGIIAFLSVGAFGAGLKYLDESAKTEKNLAANDRSLINSINPFTSAAPPSPTPQLSKELIYAGSRLLAVEDKNASAAPPSDLAIWRPTTGEWWVLTGPGTWTTQGWGQLDDIPIPGDYDGDGKTDFSVMRENFQNSGYNRWFIIRTSDNAWSIYDYSVPGDLPAQADYDGDGRTDSAVFRPSNNTWYIQGSSAGFYSQSFGASGDKPAPADYDGDGRADLGVFRPTTNTFYSFGSAVPGMTVAETGLPTGGYDWETASSDYDGDGRADYAAYDKSTANWHIRPSSGSSSGLGGTAGSNGFIIVQWGASTDRAVQNDYDGDGKTDISTWRNSNGNWYIRQSALSNSLRQVGWGQSGDIPVPALYRR